MGICEPDAEKLLPFIGPPLRTSFKEFYNMSDDEAEKAVVYYRERFAEKGIYENALFDGVELMLKNLFAKGKTIILATSKAQIYAEQILQYFSIDKYFHFIAGSNFDGTRTEKREVITYAFENCKNAKKDKSIMVGDRKHDIIGAKDNNILSAAVLFGYGSIEELSSFNPDYIVGSVEELERLLLR